MVDAVNLYEFSRNLILNSRKAVYQAANFAMVETYWRIGEKIVEEQGGMERAKYGDELIAGLSEKLTAEFGKGFTIRNLRAMRQFYTLFPIRHAVRAELTWTHYRSLIRIHSKILNNVSSRLSVSRSLKSLSPKAILLHTNK